MSPGARWIALVLGLLVGNAIAMGVLLAKAGDPTPRVLPDYYRRAVAWDDTMAARRASAELGWSAATSLDADHLAVVLVDSAGAPVTGATVTITARHRSRADGVTATTLDETAPGRYLAEIPFARPGLHELEISARRAGAAFLATALVER